MSNLVNLLRDQAHVAPDAAYITFSSNWGTIASGAVLMNNSAVVNQTSGSASHPHSTRTGQGLNTWRAAGVLISQPVVDDTPYRVKAYAYGEQSTMFVVCGYSPEAPTGTADNITKVVAYPITAWDKESHGVFDEIILMPGLQQSDPDFGKPIAFGVAIASPSGVIPNAGYNISVQNLAKTAPQFAASMS